MFGSMDFERIADRLRDFDEILFIFGRDDDGRDATAQRGQKLFLEAADRQDMAAQRNFAGHRDILANRNAGQCRYHRGDHADARRGAILGNRAFGEVDVDILAAE